jgi:sugar phosphate permease
MRWRVFTSTWLSYAGFYLTRKALAAARIPMLDDPEPRP